MTSQGQPSEKTSEVASIKASDLANKQFVRQVHKNISSNIILTTEDKALICLMKNLDRLRYRDAWQTPAGILATLLTVMLTAEAKDAFGFSKETWTAVGIVATAFTIGCLSLALKRWWTSRDVTPESVVNMLKSLSDPDVKRQARGLESGLIC